MHTCRLRSPHWNEPTSLFGQRSAGATRGFGRWEQKCCSGGGSAHAGVHSGGLCLGAACPRGCYCPQMLPLPLSLLLSGVALAQDSSPVDPPIPTASAPWTAVITAYALPPQKVEYLTDDQQWRSCVVRLVVRPDGAHSVTAGECPEPMKADAVLATEQWRFAPAPGAKAAGTATLSLTYQLQYSAALGVTTLHAEVDPGPTGADLEGRPGLVLIHGPYEDAELLPQLPRAAKKAGISSGTCLVKVQVGVDGRASATAVDGCDATLAADARALVAKSRWTPRTVDGQARAVATELTLVYGATDE